jgi:hypothetical protein
MQILVKGLSVHNQVAKAADACWIQGFLCRFQVCSVLGAFVARKRKNASDHGEYQE